MSLPAWRVVCVEIQKREQQSRNFWIKIGSQWKNVRFSDLLGYTIAKSLMTAEPPSVKQLLAHDETIINPYYMRQLLEYGIKLGKESKGTELNSEALVREAEVRTIFLISWHVHKRIIFSAFGRGTKIYRLFGRLSVK
jgi:hypothetical protein